MELRPYQQKAISMLYAWARDNVGNPCIVMPTGSGKSIIIAKLCADLMLARPEARVLMLTDSSKLIEQNASKLRAIWPDAPIGIYSAGLGQKVAHKPIIFGGIQSLAGKAMSTLGFIDLVIIDEAHMINHKEAGQYRTILNDLRFINPKLRIVGLTATPYRLSHGMITDAPAIFDKILEPISIRELTEQGYLARLKSKLTKEQVITAGIQKRGGEYVAKDLDKKVNTDDYNSKIVEETIALAGDRKHWLVFAVSIEHARELAKKFKERGVAAESIDGQMGKLKNAIIDKFETGEIRCLVNVNLLTKGYDFPDIDLIVFARPTLSPGLYVQMAGRGTRIKSHTDHCLVLDFVGNVSTHGPITDVVPPSPAGSKLGDKEPPVKVCDKCAEIVHLAAKVCPSCGAEFPPPPEKKYKLGNADISGMEPMEIEVTKWRWKRHISSSSGKEMLKVKYYGVLDEMIEEYLLVAHGGYAGKVANQTLANIAYYAGLKHNLKADLNEIAKTMEALTPPSLVRFAKNGKFFDIKERVWTHQKKSQLLK